MIYQEKRDKEGNGEEKKENLKGKKWKIENGRGKVWKQAEDFFLFIFLIIYLFIYLFILLVTFWNHWNLCLGSTKMDNFTRKIHISCWEKIRKPDFAPSEKYSSYTTAQMETQIMGAHWCFK